MRVKINPTRERREAGVKEKNEGLQTEPKLLTLCVALTTRNSDWLFHGKPSISFKNAPVTIYGTKITRAEQIMTNFLLYAVFNGIKLLGDEAAFPKHIIFLYC